MKTTPESITGFLTRFPDEEACRIYFERIRFRDGEYCPHCGHTIIYHFKDGKRYRCAECHRDFTIKTGTIFGESKLPLKKWFLAIYLLSTCKKGISSVQLAAQVGVTQKTAWFMDHRIREAMKQGNGLLFGAVEADETFIGGKAKNMHAKQRREKITGRGPVGKAIAFGLSQRDGSVRATVIPDTTMSTIEAQVTGSVKPGADLYTDELASYHRLNEIYGHQKVNHAAGEYVRAKVHTNSVESFWALFKRGYIGIYHWMSPKHLQRYLDEFTYRLNNRKESFALGFQDTIDRVSESEWLPYKVLTA
jgi:transposase-like protein